jgi:hypothetical protein
MMSIVVSRGNNLDIKLGLLKLHSNHLQIAKCYPHLKEGQYTYSYQLTHLETILLRFFWETLQFEVVVPQLCTFHAHPHMSA